MQHTNSESQGEDSTSERAGWETGISKIRIINAEPKISVLPYITLHTGAIWLPKPQKMMSASHLNLQMWHGIVPLRQCTETCIMNGVRRWKVAYCSWKCQDSRQAPLLRMGQESLNTVTQLSTPFKACRISSTTGKAWWSSQQCCRCHCHRDYPPQE